MLTRHRRVSAASLIPRCPQRREPPQTRSARAHWPARTAGYAANYFSNANQWPPMSRPEAVETMAILALYSIHTATSRYLMHTIAQTRARDGPKDHTRRHRCLAEWHACCQTPFYHLLAHVPMRLDIFVAVEADLLTAACKHTRRGRGRGRGSHRMPSSPLRTGHVSHTQQSWLDSTHRPSTQDVDGCRQPCRMPSLPCGQARPHLGFDPIIRAVHKLPNPLEGC